ncbi:MAG: rubrerythrin family protein [Promethearchaeota archaeon]
MGNRIKALQEAMIAEFNAIRKYEAYAGAAESEGFPVVARLFRALAAGERIHLRNHKHALGQDYKPVEQDFDVKSTLENLQSAFKIETLEYKKIYPSLIRDLGRTKSEDDELAKLSMKWAQEVEKTHALIIKKAIDSLNQGGDLDSSMKFFVCEACGNLHFGSEPPDELCPVCRHDPIFYKEVAG